MTSPIDIAIKTLYRELRAREAAGGDMQPLYAGGDDLNAYISAFDMRRPVTPQSFTLVVL